MRKAFSTGMLPTRATINLRIVLRFVPRMSNISGMYEILTDSRQNILHSQAFSFYNLGQNK